MDDGVNVIYISGQLLKFQDNAETCMHVQYTNWRHHLMCVKSSGEHCTANVHSNRCRLTMMCLEQRKNVFVLITSFSLLTIT